MNVEFRPQTVSITVNPQTMGIGFSPPIAREYVDRDPYTGNYTIAPGTEEQVLSTKNLWMTDNITIEAIPQNYGLITWNGTVLTVS